MKHFNASWQRNNSPYASVSQQPCCKARHSGSKGPKLPFLHLSYLFPSPFLFISSHKFTVGSSSVLQSSSLHIGLKDHLKLRKQKTKKTQNNPHFSFCFISAALGESQPFPGHAASCSSAMLRFAKQPVPTEKGKKIKRDFI